MRDLSSIRARLNDEQPKIRPQRETNITSVRLDEISKDPVIKETKALSQVRKRFKDNIQVKQKELTSLVDTITRNRQLASDEIEKVLKDAHTRAKTLISQAESAKNEADNILNVNIAHKEKLTHLDEEVTKREANVVLNEASIKQKTAVIIKDRETTQKNLLLTDKRYQEALGCCISAFALLTLAVDQMENLGKIRTEVSEAIYQNLSKVGIIESKIIELTKLVDIDKSLLRESHKELQDKEIYLRDREAMLERTSKELQLKGGY